MVDVKEKTRYSCLKTAVGSGACILQYIWQALRVVKGAIKERPRTACYPFASSSFFTCQCRSVGGWSGIGMLELWMCHAEPRTFALNARTSGLCRCNYHKTSACSQIMLHLSPRIRERIVTERSINAHCRMERDKTGTRVNFVQSAQLQDLARQYTRSTRHPILHRLNPSCFVCTANRKTPTL